MMEYCDLGDLDEFFENYSKILQGLDPKITLMKQIIQGIAFLHLKNIVHRDIKPGNILLKNEDGSAVVKLGDFGLSKILDPNSTTSSMSSDVGTVIFKAPEFFNQNPQGKIRNHRTLQD